MEIRFTANDKGKPPSYVPILSTARKKVADCELVFNDGPLAGYKLQGFVIWERILATGTLPVGNLSVTPPDFQYRDTAGLQTCSLLRPEGDYSHAHVHLRGELRETILDAYRKWSKSKCSKAGRLLDKVVGA